MGALDWLKTIGGFAGAPFTNGATLPLALSGLAGLGGGLSNREQTAKSTSTFNNQSSGSSIGETSPQYDPTTDILKNTLASKYYDMITGDPGFINQGVNTINQDADLYKQAIQGNLAARGIQGPAAANAENVAEGNRFANILQFKQNAPLAALKDATSFFSTVPYGQFSKAYTDSGQSGTGSGTQTNPGNVAGGALSGASDMLAFLYGLAGKNKPAASSGPYPNGGYPQPADGSFGQ